jgi:hypothetical protein
MYLVARSQLKDFLCGGYFDPDGTNREEMVAFADKILEHCPTDLKLFLFSDHENGDDPEIHWPFRQRLEELIPLTYAAGGSGYYGLIAERREDVEDGEILYQCYLGGSAGNSAPGFVVTPLAQWQAE